MRRTVMVADDIEFVRKTISRFLSEAHYHVVGEAKNGEEAYLLYQRLRPDLVIMDMVMPIMSGIEATRKITKIDKEANIIMISGIDQEQLVMEAVGAGARDFILKPFHADDVLKSIDNIFRDKHAGAKSAVGG